MTTYLIDTNILIYYLAGAIPDDEKPVSLHICSLREDLHDLARIRERQNEGTINIAELKTSLCDPTEQKLVNI
jgi:hypothetical protein